MALTMPGSKHAMPGVSMVGSMLKDGMPRVLILMMILLAAVQPVDVVEYDAIEFCCRACGGKSCFAQCWNEGVRLNHSVVRSCGCWKC